MIATAGGDMSDNETADVDAAGAPATGVPVRTGRDHVVTALIAAVWTYGGRATGLLWTVTLIAQLGVGSYGQYAMAFAIGTIASAPLDNPFGVRAIRESEELFYAERTLRMLIPVAMIVLGLALLPFSYYVWFGLIAGGGEMVFSAYKSLALRDGHPDVVQRMDTIRQVSAVVLGAAYLYAAPHPTLTIASMLYVVPYLVVALLTIRVCWGHRPAFPGRPKIALVLFGEHLANALYLQGDVLLLGILTDSTVAGYYSITVVTSWAVAQVGLALGGTYHEKLRASGGQLSSAPPLKHTLGLAVVGSILVFVTGVIMLVFVPEKQLPIAMMVMAGFVFLRIINYVYTTVLSIQARDVVRSAAAVVVVPIKLGILAALVAIGAVGAAIGSVVADAVLLAIYVWVLRHPGSLRTAAAAQRAILQYEGRHRL